MNIKHGEAGIEKQTKYCRSRTHKNEPSTWV